MDLELINIDKNILKFRFDVEKINFASNVVIKIAIFDVMYIEKCSGKRVSHFK